MNQETLERLRKQYPVGTRVKLVKMDDIQAPPVGTLGTVMGVDDIDLLWFHGTMAVHFLLYMERIFAVL